MPKPFLTVIALAIILSFSGSPTRAQQTQVAEREAEWQKIALPQTTFVRQIDPNKTLLFQVPSEWKLQPLDKLLFAGPHGATLNVVIEKIPDGLPLRHYVSALLQGLSGVADAADSMVVRRTTMSALEAREIMFETDAGSHEVSRRIIWTTVSGPNAVNFILIAPVGNVAEIEPYFKAIVQSVTFVDKGDYAGFDALRTRVIKDSGPTRIDEVQSLALALTALDGSKRGATIKSLATIFSSSPNIAIDLVLDGRPFVRAGVLEAIAQSGNPALEQFLLRALFDRDLLVAEQAARSIAANPNALKLLRDHSMEWYTVESIARVWPFLSRNNQVKILEEIFAQRLAPLSANSQPSLKLKTPPAPSVTVRATVLPPGSVFAPPPVQVMPVTSEPIRHRNALTLIRDLPVSEFKLPLASILAAKDDELTILALQMSWHRHEVLPAPELLKLVASSSDSEVRRLAILHLGQSGGAADTSAPRELPGQTCDRCKPKQC